MDESIKKYEKTRIYLFKASNGKSVTMPISKDDFLELLGDSDEVVFNVSLNGLVQFLTTDKGKRFGLNRIRKL